MRAVEQCMSQGQASVESRSNRHKAEALGLQWESRKQILKFINLEVSYMGSKALQWRYVCCEIRGSSPLPPISIFWSSGINNETQPLNPGDYNHHLNRIFLGCRTNSWATVPGLLEINFWLWAISLLWASISLSTKWREVMVQEGLSKFIDMQVPCKI